MSDEELVSFLERCTAAFEWWNNSMESDRSLAEYFADRVGNADLPTLLEKVRRLEREYATRITTRVTWEGMARHILGVRFPDPPAGRDERLAIGDFRCVDLIEALAPAETRNGKPAKLRSFAAKYCHFSSPEAFPIYDSYADAALTLLNGR